MTNKEVAQLIASCLEQRINNDDQIDDTGREWFYVSGMYKKDQEVESISPPELVQRIRALKLDSIKEVEAYTMGSIDSRVRDFIQIKGNRIEIIKECLTIK